MTLINALDCSNWNGTFSEDQAAAIAAAAPLVIVRASLESPAKQAIARQQIGALAAAGATTHAYPWCYADWDPRQTVRDTIALLADLAVPMLWLDVEDTDSFKQTDRRDAIIWILRALDELARTAIPAGIYTANWCWQPITGGTDAFSSVPLWVADYDHQPNLSFTPFGGWDTCAGKQHTPGDAGGPFGLDMSVFESDRLPPAALPAAARPRPATS